MSQYLSGTSRVQKWYNRSIFPLLPYISSRKADEYNTSQFCIRWLMFTVWILDSFEFEISIVANTHWGIGMIGMLPYLRWVVAIPCPEKLGIWIYKYTSRKVKFIEANNG